MNEVEFFNYLIFFLHVYYKPFLTTFKPRITFFLSFVFFFSNILLKVFIAFLKISNFLRLHLKNCETFGDFFRAWRHHICFVMFFLFHQQFVRIFIVEHKIQKKFSFSNSKFFFNFKENFFIFVNFFQNIFFKKKVTQFYSNFCFFQKKIDLIV